MKSLLLFILLCAVGNLAAQTTLQVATRNIRKTIAWKPGYELVINGEKAEVQVAPADTTAVIVTAELSAKHPSLDTASNDLDAWQFVVSTVGKKIYIRAYIGLPNGKKFPVSNMKVKITVLVPKNCPVNLSNKFGKARLEQLEGPIALTGEFCSFQLVGLRGNVNINSQYGNIDGRQLGGKIDIQSKRTDIQLDGIRADCTIHSEYGQMVLNAPDMAGNLLVVGNRSDVTLEVPVAATHNISLHAAYSAVDAPSEFDTSASTVDNPRAILHRTADAPTITVETTFGKIIVKH